MSSPKKTSVMPIFIGWAASSRHAAPKLAAHFLKDLVAIAEEP